VAIPLRPVVDVVEDVRPSAGDRALIAMAVLAPLALFALNAWRASLETWYSPLDSSGAGYFGEQFGRNVASWFATGEAHGAKLVLILDRDCPCANAARSNLDAAVAQSSRKDVQVVLRYVDDVDTHRDSAWRAVLRGLPSTPTLLAIDGRTLVYAGPVNSGNLCTTSVQRVLGVTALQTPQSHPIFNWLERGCYCRLPANAT